MSAEDKTKDSTEDIETNQEETIETTIEEVVEEINPLEVALAEAADYKDKYYRVHADFDNSKKRLEREKSNAVSYANESFAKDMLAVMDSFESAISSMDKSEDTTETIEQIKEGIHLTFEQLKKILIKNSIKEVDCEGEFDPEVHQAIMQVESENHEVGDVVQVMQKGYTIKDRILRPAMVSTCK